MSIMQVDFISKYLIKKSFIEYQLLRIKTMISDFFIIFESDKILGNKSYIKEKNKYY